MTTKHRPVSLVADYPPGGSIPPRIVSDKTFVAIFDRQANCQLESILEIRVQIPSTPDQIPCRGSNGMSTETLAKTSLAFLKLELGKESHATDRQSQFIGEAGLPVSHILAIIVVGNLCFPFSIRL